MQLKWTPTFPWHHYIALAVVPFSSCMLTCIAFRFRRIVSYLYKGRKRQKEIERGGKRDMMWCGSSEWVGEIKRERSESDQVSEWLCEKREKARGGDRQTHSERERERDRGIVWATDRAKQRQRWKSARDRESRARERESERAREQESERKRSRKKKIFRKSDSWAILSCASWLRISIAFFILWK